MNKRKYNRIKSGMHVATGPTENLKWIRITDHEDFEYIFDKTDSLQGYVTNDDFCLPLIEMNNYYVDPTIIPIIMPDLYSYQTDHYNFSICELETVCSDEKKEKLGSIVCNLEYLLINEGDQCIWDEYDKVTQLNPRIFSLSGGGAVDEDGHAMINLYCLYGDKTLPIIVGDDGQSMLGDQDHQEL